MNFPTVPWRTDFGKGCPRLRRAFRALVLTLSGVGVVCAQTNVFPTSGNVGIGTTSPGNPLAVNGTINAGSNYYNCVSWNGFLSPVSGIKIKTNIPFASSTAMPTLFIEGYA